MVVLGRMQCSQVGNQVQVSGRHKGIPLRVDHSSLAQLITVDWDRRFSPVYSAFLDATTRASSQLLF